MLTWDKCMLSSDLHNHSLYYWLEGWGWGCRSTQNLNCGRLTLKPSVNRQLPEYTHKKSYNILMHITTSAIECFVSISACPSQLCQIGVIHGLLVLTTKEGHTPQLYFSVSYCRRSVGLDQWKFLCKHTSPSERKWLWTGWTKLICRFFS